jgi:hypothetical protein
MPWKVIKLLLNIYALKCGIIFGFRIWRFDAGKIYIIFEKFVVMDKVSIKWVKTFSVEWRRLVFESKCFLIFILNTRRLHFIKISSSSSSSKSNKTIDFKIAQIIRKEFTLEHHSVRKQRNCSVKIKDD